MRFATLSFVALFLSAQPDLARAAPQGEQGDPIASALARIAAAKSSGAHESAVRELWKLRATMRDIGDAARRSRALSQIDPRIRELDPAGKRRLAAQRKLGEKLRKLASAYQGKELHRIAADISRRADALDPARAASRASSAAESERSVLQEFFQNADTIYDDVSWPFEGDELVSPLPQGDTHMLLARDEVSGDYTIRFEYRLAQGLGQFALAYGYKSPRNFHIFEVDLLEGASAGCWFAHLVDNKPKYLFRSSRGLTNAQRKGWLPMQLDVRGEWMTMSIGAVHYSIPRNGAGVSGRFGFFLSGATRAKEPVRIRKLSVIAKAAPAASETSAEGPAQRAEAALAALAKGEGVEELVRGLWRLQRASLRAADEDAAAGKDREKRVARALMRHDPLELKRRQAGAAVRRALAPIAGLYESKAWREAARDVWRSIVEADARDARRELERLSQAAPATGSADPKPAEPVELEAKGLLAGAVYPWSKSAWTIDDGVLVAPKPGSDASACLSAKSYSAPITLEAEVQLGVRGELGFLFGFRAKDDLRSIYFSHVGREETRATVAVRKGKEWLSASTQLTNVYAGDKRDVWIPVRVELRADSLLVAMGELPPRRLRVRSSVKGRIGFMVGADSRAHQRVRIRKLRVRVGP